jgi:hypothetical protein
MKTLIFILFLALAGALQAAPSEAQSARRILGIVSGDPVPATVSETQALRQFASRLESGHSVGLAPAQSKRLLLRKILFALSQ